MELINQLAAIGAELGTVDHALACHANIVASYHHSISSFSACVGNDSQSPQSALWGGVELEILSTTGLELEAARVEFLKTQQKLIINLALMLARHPGGCMITLSTNDIGKYATCCYSINWCIKSERNLNLKMSSFGLPPGP